EVITGEPPPPKVAGSVNLYTEEFFSIMNSRLKEGGIATFWLPVDQLKVSEAKAILRAFRNAFPNTSVWASADEDWIMMGVKGPGRRVEEGDIRRLLSNPGTGADLRRMGIEVPEQLGALFLMDGEEIDRITGEIAPLTDFYPKRLSDAAWDESASHRFASTYMVASSAIQRFLDDAIRLLESEKKLGALELNDLFILTYLYCVNGEVNKAEDLVASSSGLIKRDWFVDWLWGKLQAEFGFHPPP